MKRPIGIWTITAMVCVLSLTAGMGMAAWAQAPAANANAPARVSGEMRDVSGNQSPNVTVTFTNTTTKQAYDTITDSRGAFNRGGVPAGNYTVTFTFNREVVYETVLVLTPGQNATLNVNFKELQAKDAAEQEDAAKKAAENRAKFGEMKARFDAGTAALEQARATRAQMDKLPKAQQDIVMDLGAELEQFGTKEAMADDQKVAEVYAKKGAKVADLDDAIVEKWRAIARATAWKDYADRTPLSAELLKLAEAVSVS